MGEPATRLDVTELLGHVAWLRRLAATLVADAARADDLTQQVVLDALARPPAEPSRTKAWLGAVARHLAWRTKLSEGRRAARERMVAPQEAVSAADEVVARTELHRRVVDAVLALDERYRTPLLLRWFDGLPPRAIAERTGEPVETVKTRLRRGLELLREQLIAARGDEQRGATGEQVLALLPLLDRPARAALRRALITGGEVAVGGGVGAVIAGVVAMGTQAKLVAAAVVLAVAGMTATWWAVDLAPPERRTSLRSGEASPVAVDAHEDPSSLSSVISPASRIDDAATVDVADAPPPPGTQPIRGRVVDETRRPVAGADVVLSITDRAPVATRTNARGEYAFAVEPLAAVELEARGSLFACDSAGRAGFVALFHPSLRDEMDFQKPRGTPETIVVRPGGALRVRIVDATGPVAGATVRLELGEERERGPTAISGADGEARFAALPIGPVIALASREGRERGRASGAVASAGGAEGLVEVALRPTRSLSLRVEDATTGRGVDGARVKLYENVSVHRQHGASFVAVDSMLVVVDGGAATTDAEGRVEFHGIETGAAWTAAAMKEGWNQVWEEERRAAWPLAEGATPPTLYLAQPKTAEQRWRISARTEPPLPEGAELKLFHASIEGRLPPPATARIVDGQVVAEVARGGELFAWAQAPDGRLTVLTSQYSTDYDDGSIDFGPGRRLVVRLRDEAGRPLAGVAAVAELVRGSSRQQPISSVVETTDASGVACFDPLPATAYRLRVAVERGALPDVALQEVDLAHADATVECTLPTTREAIVEVTVDGAHRLPSDLAIRQGIDVPSRRVEDFESGELHLFFVPRDDAPAWVMLEATGWLPTLVEIPWPAGGEPPRISVVLPRAATLTARLLAPAGAVCRPTLQRWREDTKQFERWSGAQERLQSPNTPDGAYRFTALPPGRWRVVEEITAIGSEVVVITPGGGDHELTLDLARTIAIAGRCVLPDDPRVSADDVELFLIDDALDPGFTGDRPMPPTAQQLLPFHGAFETWLDGSRRWRLVARTPLHRLATADGTLPIAGSRRDLELRFEERPLARFQVRSETGAELAWLSIHCCEPAEAGATRRPIARCVARRDGDAYVFAPPVGTFDLVASTSGHPSVLRRAVRFDGSPLDLGELLFESGSQLTVNVRSKSIDRPSTTLVARRLDDDELAPFDAQESCARGAGVHRLEGLRRGRWRVELLDPNSRSVEALRTADVDLDGEHDATIELALD